MLYVSREVRQDLPDRALQILPLLKQKEQILFEIIYLKVPEETRYQPDTSRLILEKVVQDQTVLDVLGQEKVWH